MSQLPLRIACALGALVFFLRAVQPIVAENGEPAADEGKTLRYSLQEGETTFILSMPKASILSGFKFVNDNPAIRGELKIAVSDSCLAANDPKWTLVNGAIPFAHKRLFNLSMLGVEAKYVKLFFHVEKKS
jgi:hypothetical protein